MSNIIEFPKKKIVDLSSVPKIFIKEIEKSISKEVETATITKAKVKKILSSGKVMVKCIEDRVDEYNHKIDKMTEEQIKDIINELDIFKPKCRINIYNPTLIHVRMLSGLSYQIQMI